VTTHSFVTVMLCRCKLTYLIWHYLRREYLQTLQSRRKWQQTQENIQEGDLVILKDGDQHRNIWPLGLIEHVFHSDDNRVWVTTHSFVTVILCRCKLTYLIWHYLTLELLATTKMTNRWIHYMNLNTVLRKWSIPVIGVYFSYLFYNMHCLYWVLVKVARAQTNKAYKQNRLFTCRNRDTRQTCYCLWCTVRLYAIWPLPTRVLESLTTDHSE
jgi:hypothetical protein